MKSYKVKREKWYIQPAFVIPAIFTISVLIRYLLSFFYSAGPTVYIDEGLYINIARSLVADGKVMYRAQPISYIYLLYPLTIMPVFLLPSSVNIYRVLQLWNVLMISTIIFPVYLLCKEVKLTRKHTYVATIASIIIPEIGLSTYLVAESLIYPLMMWILLLGYLVISKPEKRIYPILFGVINGIAYFAKPECIVFGACHLIILCIHGFIKKRSFRHMMPIIVSGILMVAEIVTGYIVYGFLFDKATVLNLYEKQIPSYDFENIMIMVQGILFHIFAFIISAGNASILIPALGFKKQTETQKIFFSSYLMAVITMIIGIGIMIVPYRYTGSWGNCPTHLRYLMYFFPILIIWLLLPELSDLRIRKKGLISLLLFTVLFIYPSAFSCFTWQAGTYDSPSLNIFNPKRIGKTIGILCICMITILNTYLVYNIYKKGYRKHIRRIAIIAIIAFMALNSAMTYANIHSMDRDFEQEANEVANALADEDFIVFTNNLYDDFRGYELDAHLHRPAQMIVANNMLLNAVETGGIYRSFTPLVQAPNTFNYPTIDTDTILFDVTTADYVEFTDDVIVTKSSGGLYTVAQITPGKPYLKSAIASMNAYTLSSSDIGSLLIYDKDLLAKGEITLHITLRAPYGETTVTFSCEGESESITATENTQTYSITLPMTQNDFFHYTIQGTNDIIIHNYYTE